MNNEDIESKIPCEIGDRWIAGSLGRWHGSSSGEPGQHTDAEIARPVLAVPFFVGKDAGDIESLVDGVYAERDQWGIVYEFAGMPSWNIIGYLEVATNDGEITFVSSEEMIAKGTTDALRKFHIADTD